MKATRYFQSCLLVEVNDVRILIDPSGQDKQTDFGKIDAVFYTHEHPDHFDAEMAQTFVEQGIAPVYANASTAKQVKASVTTVKDGQAYEVNGVKIKALELPHCLMIDGSEGPQNTGYLVNDELFHPGDGKELDGLTVKTLAVPLSGPDVSAHDAFKFGKQVGAQNLIPIHYDFMGGNPGFFATTAEKAGMKTHILEKGQPIEI